MSARHTNRLSLTPLEDRTTPATVTYSLQTLTVTPAPGEEISVGQTTSGNAGFLLVEMSNSSFSDITIFDSGSNKPVRNLVINGTKAPNLELTFGTLTVPNVTIYGSESSSDVTLSGSTLVTGNLRFVGHVRGLSDTIFLNQGNVIGGSATFDMRGGTNALYNRGGGQIGGNFVYRGGSGDDTINLAMNGSALIKGYLSISDPGGTNIVACNTGRTVTVEKNMMITGGIGTDNVNWSGATAINVLGNTRISLGAGTNDIDANNFSTTGLFTILGGPNNDQVTLRGATRTVNGQFLAQLGNGSNEFELTPTLYSTFGKNLSYRGGTGPDVVLLNSFGVQGDTFINVGSATGVPDFVGLSAFGGTADLQGRLSITGGNGPDQVRLFRTTVSKTLHINTTGGDDSVSIDDSFIAGTATIYLGAGADQFLADTKATNNAGTAMSGTVIFGSHLTVSAWTENDLVDLSNSSGESVEVRGNTRLMGGAGTDTFVHFGGNTYGGTKFEDFESGESF